MTVTNEQNALWERAKEMLRPEAGVGPYNSWIGPSLLRAVSGDTMLIEVPDMFALGILNKRYYSTIEAAVERTFGRRYKIIFAMANDIQQHLDKLSHSMLNRDYTFENYVVGPSNSFAYSASVAVAEDPSGTYNPLFIYGGVGLGKTHLMNAIGNQITQTDPGKNVLFISSETFTNEFIDSLKKNGTSELREKMRSADVFMVDDIQFLARTMATQEEFFHTFNDLHLKGKQIILSSDRPPNEIPAIEIRLRSRFEMGLIVDIRKPDFETRMAILRRKCEDEDLDFPGEVLEYIAGRLDSNIRELEGALNRLKAKSELIGGRVTLEYAIDTLEPTLPAIKSASITTQSVLAAVAERYAVTTEDMVSKKRNREYTLPRQIAMLLLRELLSMSTTAIGQELGGRDHTTVMHGCEKMEKAMKEDPTFRRSIEELKEAIKAG